VETAEKYIQPHPPSFLFSATWRAGALSRRFFVGFSFTRRPRRGERRGGEREGEKERERERKGASGAESFSAQLLFGGSL